MANKQPSKGETLTRDLEAAYCNFCQSNDLRITRVIKVECKKCGKTRLITTKIR